MSSGNQNSMPRKPNYFMMLIKYPSYYTGNFNWISLSILGILIFDIPIARALKAGDFAWFFAVIFVAALFLGVPFALYITFLDYNNAMSSYRSEIDVLNSESQQQSNHSNGQAS